MADNELKEDKVIKSTPKCKKSVKKENTKAQEIYYSSVVGDTSYTIAKKYNVAKEEIDKLNNIDWLNMKVGTLVRVK